MRSRAPVYPWNATPLAAVSDTPPPAYPVPSRASATTSRVHEGIAVLHSGQLASSPRSAGTFMSVCAHGAQNEWPHFRMTLSVDVHTMNM